MNKLTIFYDGRCPLCVKEMGKLTQYDRNQSIKLVDIHRQDMEAFTMVDPIKASQIIHAIDDNNELLLGLDALHQAWKLVGKGWLYAPLRLPIIRPFADWFYIQFASNRYKWSKWLTGKSYCENDQCSH